MQNAPEMQDAEEVRPKRFTADQVMAMDEAGLFEAWGEKVELIDGELFVLSPAKPPHAGTVVGLAEEMRRAYGPGWTVREEKPLLAGTFSLPEPDLMVVAGDHWDWRLRHPVCEEARLVVEVVWSTHDYDRRKRRVYAQHGAPVYWMLDLPGRRLEVHTDPQPDGTYRLVRVLREDEDVVLPGTLQRLHVGDLLLPPDFKLEE